MMEDAQVLDAVGPPLEPTVMRLRVVPVDLKTANEFVRRRHRHSRPVVGYKFAVGVEDETGTLRGVAIVGRPVAPKLDDGLAAEITRLCTDGARNACSITTACSGAAWTAAETWAPTRNQ
jgi:hypothetical protein